MKTISFNYDSGNMPDIHPDKTINQSVLIDSLVANLNLARSALNRVLTMSVVTEAAVSMKNHVRWVLDETSPKKFRVRNEQETDEFIDIIIDLLPYLTDAIDSPDIKPAAKPKLRGIEKRVERDEESLSFYQDQIEEAERQGKDGFDSERFLVKRGGGK